ncbi:MAG: DUF262 domain-containing protein [Rhizobiaceae bacterium]|nr:DUF262 domain-containing protein [Rhizobiaceae bacterium]
MKIEHERQTLEELHRGRETINLTPMWQRGRAWTEQKQVLLIDSILRGMDMPKIYLWRRKKNGRSFDVVDGQQRLRAVWDFMDGNYELKHSQPLQPVGKTEIAGKSFCELSERLKQKLRDFEVSIALIEKAETQDITLLFARLQLAAPLNSAELRNAILCPLRHEVDATALNHEFFRDCSISSRRMKHQDYTAHAYALCANGDQADLKAPDLRELYIQSTEVDQQLLMDQSKQIGEALTLLQAVNANVNQRITQKWIFCDLIYLLIKRVRDGITINLAEFATVYQEFDVRRLTHTKNADVLLEGDQSDEDQDLYDYIQAFRIEGGRKENIAARAAVIERLFEDCVS